MFTFDDYDNHFFSNIYDDSIFFVERANIPNNLDYHFNYYVSLLFFIVGLILVFSGKFLKQ